LAGNLRSTYLRLADPTGTPARLAFLVCGLGSIGAYALFQQRGWVARLVPPALAGVILAYGGTRWWARRVVKRAGDEELRREIARKALKVLTAAPSLPVRALLWLGLGGWGWATVLRGSDYPFGGDRAMAVFLGAMGLILGARYLVEWRVEVPALRADLEALGIIPRG